MSKKQVLDAERFYFFSDFSFKLYNPEPDIKKILQFVLPGAWTFSFAQKSTLYEIDKDFSDLLLDRVIQLIEYNLKKNHIHYSLERIGLGKIKLKNNPQAFLSINKLLDCSIKYRMLQFRNDSHRYIAQLMTFYKKSESQLQKIQALTDKTWKMNFDFKHVPKVYFSSRFPYKDEKFLPIADSIFNIKYDQETKIYPRFEKIPLNNPKNFFSNNFFRNKIFLTIVLSKLITAATLYSVNGSFLFVSFMLYLSKIPVFLLNNYIFKWHCYTEESPLKIDFMSTFFMCATFYSMNLSLPIIPVIFDFLVNILTCAGDKNDLILESQEQSRRSLNGLLDYYFDDYQLNIELVEDPFDNNKYKIAKCFFKMIKLLLEAFEIEKYLKYFPDSRIKFFDIFSLKFLQIDLGKKFSKSAYSKTLFSIVINNFYFFGVDHTFHKNNCIFVFPCKETELGLYNDFLNRIAVLIEESFIVIKKLQKLNIDKSLYHPDIIKIGQDGYLGSAAILKFSVDQVTRDILEKNFELEDKIDGEYLHLILVKQEILIESKSKNFVNDNSKKDEVKKEDKIFKSESYDQEYKSNRSKNTVKTNEKVSVIEKHLRGKDKNIRISRRPDHNIIMVYTSFKNLQTYLMDFASDAVKIQKGLYIILYFKKIYIKIWCNVKNNQFIDSKYKNDLSKSVKKPTKKLPEIKGEQEDTQELVSESESSKEGSYTEVSETDISTDQIGGMKLISLIPQLIADLAEQFKNATGKEYDFFQPDQEHAYRLWEHFLICSFYSHICYSEGKVDIYGGYILKTLLQLKIKKNNDTDLRIIKPSHADFNFDEFIKKLLEKANEFIIGAKASLIKNINLYTVEMKEGDIVDFRLSDADNSETDILNIDGVWATLFVTVDWSSPIPKVLFQSPKCAERFVECIKKGIPPPLEFVKNYPRARQLLNNFEIKRDVQRMLETIYPKAKINIEIMLKNLHENQENTDQPLFLEEVALYILNIIFDVKRIFRMFTAMDMIKFMPNEWAPHLTGALLPNLFQVSRLCYPPKTTDDKNYITFNDIVLKKFKKYFISNTSTKPPIVESFKTLFKFSKIILTLDAKIDVQAQKIIDDISEHAPNFLVSVPSVRAYYIKLVKPLRIKGRNDTLIHIFLILFTFAQKNAGLRIDYFKKKLGENAKLFQYPLDIDQLFNKHDEKDFDYLPSAFPEILTALTKLPPKGLQEKALDAKDLIFCFGALNPFNLWGSPYLSVQSGVARFNLRLYSPC